MSFEIGDRVVRKLVVGAPDSPENRADMEGVVVRVTPTQHGSGGTRAHVRVRWASGSEAIHDDRQLALVSRGFGDLGAPDITRESVLARFIAVANRVWGQDLQQPWPSRYGTSGATEPKITFKLGTDQPWGGREEVLAGLVYVGNPMAYGTHLIKFPREVMLLVADSLMSKPDDKIEQVLIHEACHIGYRRHDTAFREVCRAAGGVVSSAGVESDAAINVQRKEGSRFVTIKSFQVEHEAVAWAKEEMKRVPGKYRLEM
jgi:hypothetical protein